MANTFPLVPVQLLGTLDAELGKGLGFKISTSSPPTFREGSIAKFDTSTGLLGDMPDGANTELVLALEPAQDPFFEAEGRDDHIKEVVAGIFLKGFRGIMSTNGAAIAASHIGAEGVLKIDATTKLPYIDLADTTTATKGVRILRLAEGYFPIQDASGNIAGVAQPAIGDTGAPVVVEFLG